MKHVFIATVLICLYACTCSYAKGTDQLQHLKTLSLENLMQVEVYSASKYAENLANVAASMYVITNEDIRRSGARTLPDLLRGVPGLSVANIDGHSWAVTARGFNGMFANKLLVLMDGRTLYTSLYSGVYWDMQDTMLEDIERIEIIRGPGASIWGANAVNGVINIITRHAEDTEGVYLQAGAGSTDKGSINARFGKSAGDLSYRAYAKFFERDNFDANNAVGEHDDAWHTEKGGFRLDWTTAADYQITVLADTYQGTADQILEDDNDLFYSNVDYSGGNLQFQLEKEQSDISTWSFQTYFDRSLRDDGNIDQTRTTWDFSFSHVYRPNNLHNLVWGGGYRHTADTTSANELGNINPNSADDQLFNLFVQDDLAFIDNELHLIIGSRFEHNDYTDYEIQPTARLLWTPSLNHTLWAALSRAIRTPSRADRYLDITTDAGLTSYVVNTPTGSVSVPVQTFLDVSGNSDFDSETVVTYEIGYRTQLHEKFSVDASIFYNHYKNVRSQIAGAPIIDTSQLPYVMTIPITFENLLDIDTYGLEISSKFTINDQWRMTLNYSFLKMEADNDDQEDAFRERIVELSPEHELSLKSYIDLPYDLELDTSLYYFSQFYNTPAHLRCDLRLGWNPTSEWELSIKGENLFDDRHREFPNNLGLVSSDVPRSWFAEIKYRY